jgi:hypothetical protein
VPCQEHETLERLMLGAAREAHQEMPETEVQEHP